MICSVICWMRFAHNFLIKLCLIIIRSYAAVVRIMHHKLVDSIGFIHWIVTAISVENIIPIDTFKIGIKECRVIGTTSIDVCNNTAHFLFTVSFCLRLDLFCINLWSFDCSFIRFGLCWTIYIIFRYFENIENII